MRTKYDTWAWNFGRSPKYDLVNKRRFDGGSLEVGLHVETGLIQSIGFYGDFLAVSSLEPLTEALVGCPFRQAEVSEILDRFPLQELFGSITKDEVLDTIFHAGDLDQN
jgi:lipoate-protein ligase A